MQNDIGFSVRVKLLNGRLNSSVENAALGWTIKEHQFKTIGLYYNDVFIWCFEAEGKTPNELLKEVINHASICECFLSAMKKEGK
jgi:hypothetical protein